MGGGGVSGTCPCPVQGYAPFVARQKISESNRLQSIIQQHCWESLHVLHLHGMSLGMGLPESKHALTERSGITGN